MFPVAPWVGASFDRCLGVAKACSSGAQGQGMALCCHVVTRSLGVHPVTLAVGKPPRCTLSHPLWLNDLDSKSSLKVFFLTSVSFASLWASRDHSKGNLYREESFMKNRKNGTQVKGSNQNYEYTLTSQYPVCLLKWQLVLSFFLFIQKSSQTFVLLSRQSKIISLEFPKLCLGELGSCNNVVLNQLSN